MKKVSFCVFIIAFLFSITASALPFDNKDIDKQTFLYSIKGSDSLYLDKYELPAITENKPCILFVFGGGFVGGNRDRKDYIPFFENLVKQGYTVVSIDYRLGIKKAMTAKAIQEKEAEGTGVKPKDVGAKDMLGIMDNTLVMAVEDLFDATAYVIDNAERWKIDKNMIVACGSSAGAITVLHGEYNIVNETELAKNKLPQNFNYAGVISFAGAIFSMNGDLKWKNKPAPIQFFHGDADTNVPYGELRIKVLGIKTKYGFFGSKHIVKQMDKMKAPYYFYDVENATHEIADSPMHKNMNEITTFLDKFVKEKQPILIHSRVQQPLKIGMKKNFGIMDFIKGNGLAN